MRVIAFPSNGYYAREFCAALAKKGVDIVPGQWSGRWALSNICGSDIVHIHWPSFYYASSGTGFFIARKLLQFVVVLFVLKVKSGGIVWTAHNLMPHERCRIKMVDVIVRRMIIKLAVAIFVHGPEAKEVLVEAFPTAGPKCVKIPFGNWIETYPPPVPCQKARNALGLSCSGVVYLCLGRCRVYKNIESVIAAFKNIADPDDRLVIAGAFSSDGIYYKKISEAVGLDRRIRIDSGFVKDDDVTLYVSSCDVMMAPYKDILTSGTAMLATSLGRPIISLNRGFLKDFVTRSTGILVEPDDLEALANAMLQAKSMRWYPECIISHARRFRYETAAEVFRDRMTKFVC